MKRFFPRQCLCFALCTVGLLGCKATQLEECQRLVAAIAEGSASAMSASPTPESSQALKRAAERVDAVLLNVPELASPRDTYVRALRKAAVAPEAEKPGPNSRALVLATSKALEDINLHCSGER